MAVQLKELQKYRYTLLIFVGLAICIIVIIASTINDSNKKAQQSPLSPSAKPPTAAFGSVDPSAIAINWQEVRIGKTYDEIQRILKPPVAQEDKNGTLIAYYETSTPNFFHKVVYKDNKAVRIDREVNERQEKITSEYFYDLYGKPEILQPGDNHQYQLESYKVNDNEYVVTQHDIIYDNIYKIINLNKEQYELFKTNEIKPDEHDDQSDFEGR